MDDDKIRQHFLPDMQPPKGGLSKLMSRIDQASSPKAEATSIFTQRNSWAWGLGVAAAISLYVAMPKYTGLAGVIASSNDLIVYKYGFKDAPNSQVLLLGDNQDRHVVKRPYGFEVLKK